MKKRKQDRRTTCELDESNVLSINGEGVSIRWFESSYGELISFMYELFNLT